MVVGRAILVSVFRIETFRRLPFGNEFEIADHVICRIIVFVMKHEPPGHFSAFFLPDVMMQ